MKKLTLAGTIFACLSVSIIGTPFGLDPAYAQAPEYVWVCYPIVTFFNPPIVRLQDQFGNETVDLNPGRLVCGIAFKNADEPPPSIFWINQFLYIGTIDPPLVTLTDQFGSEKVNIGLSSDVFGSASVNGQPTEVEAVYWKSYPALGSIDSDPVDIKGAFGNETLNPGPAVALLVPVLQNGNGSQEFPHYRCYNVTGQVDPPEVRLAHEYAIETVDPLPASLLCIPTEKELNPDDQPGPVGGEILSIDAIPLFVAGAAANAFWILPLFAGAATLGIMGIRRILR